MARVLEMLNLCGSFEAAEKQARQFIADGQWQVWLDLGLLYAAQGRFDEAWKCDLEYAKFAPDCPRLGYNTGWKLLSEGKFQEGMLKLERGREINNFGSAQDFPRLKPIWDGSEGRGKTLLLACESGLGDEIINVRCARYIERMGFKIVIACNQGLVELFSTAGASAVAPKHAALQCHYDVWCPAMSAPRLLGWTYETLPGQPYLSVPANNKAWDKIIPADTINIGLRWAGNPKYELEQFRKFDPQLMFNLAKDARYRFFSLQRDDDCVPLPTDITDLAPLLATWNDTANAVARMDLVITSCTSIAHLCGALGKQTWVISPIMPYYVWAMPGNTSVWYKSVRLFRQTKFGEWSDVFEKIAHSLANL